MTGDPLKITALIGSPRRKNTLRLVEVVEDELKRLGPVEVEYVFLGERNIEMCRGCMVCLAKGWEHCPIRDDLQDIMGSIEKSDGVILASPVYIYHVTAQTKRFLDRLPAFCHRPAFFHKHAMAVVTTGAVGVRPTLKYMKSMLGVMGFRTVAGVGGTGENDDGSLPAKLEQRARKAAGRFHRNLMKGDSVPPSLSSMIQFRIQRRAFTTSRAAGIFPADNAHYTALKGRPYPVEAPLRPCFRVAAWLLDRIAALFIGM